MLSREGERGSEGSNGSLQRRVSEPSVPRAGEAIQDQLNSNGIPRFLDFFSRGTDGSNPSPSSAESCANPTSAKSKIRVPRSSARSRPTRTKPGRTGLQVTTLGYGAMELRGAPRARDISEAQAETILNNRHLDRLRAERGTDRPLYLAPAGWNIIWPGND